MKTVGWSWMFAGTLVMLGCNSPAELEFAAIAAKGDAGFSCELEKSDDPSDLVSGCVDDACSAVRFEMIPPVGEVAWTLDGEELGEGCHLDVVPNPERAAEIIAKTPDGVVHRMWMMSVLPGEVPGEVPNVVTFIIPPDCSAFEITTVGGCFAESNKIYFGGIHHAYTVYAYPEPQDVVFNVSTRWMDNAGFADAAVWTGLTPNTAYAHGNPKRRGPPGQHFTFWFDLAPGDSMLVTVQHGDGALVENVVEFACSSQGAPLATMIAGG